MIQRNITSGLRWLMAVVMLIIIGNNNSQLWAQPYPVSAAKNGYSTAAGFVQLYLLTDASGNIIASNGTGSFPTEITTPGNYRIYAVNYETATGSVATSGNISTAVTATCYEMDYAPVYVVCQGSLPSPSTLQSSAATPTTGYSMTYVLVDAANTIINSTSAVSYTITATDIAALGNYRLWAIWHDASTVIATSGTYSVSGGCYDADYALISVVSCCAPEAGTLTVAPNPVCAGTDVTLSTSGNNTTGYTTEYFVRNAAGVVAGPQAGGTFTTTGLTGSYEACVLNYKNGTTAPSGAALVAGTNTTAPDCYEIACATFTVVAPVSAGTFTPMAAVCNSSTTAIDLSALLTGESTGGTWSFIAGPQDPSAAFAAPNFTPTNLLPGIYSFQYTVTGTAPCPSDNEIITVTVSDQLSAGTASPALYVCVAAPQLVDLAALLSGEDATGTWTAGAGNPAGGTFNAAAGTFNTNGGALGTYTFTYAVTSAAPCVADDETVTIVIANAPSAGVGQNASVCSSGAALDLFALLTGEQAGGTWAANAGNPAGGTFTGAAGTFDPAGASGTYSFTYTINATAPCLGSDQETVIVTVTTAPVAGTAVTGTTACSSSTTPIDLYTLVTGEQSGGTWAASPTNPSGGTFLAGAGAFTPNGASSGTYTFTYTVNGTGACSTPSAVSVSIDVTTAPNAGVASAPANACANDPATITLANLLTGEQTGGTWAAGAGNPAGGTFSAAAGTFVANGATAGTFTFTYTVTGTAGCSGQSDSETVTVNVLALPVGTATPSTAETCSGGSVSIALSANQFALFAWTPASIPAGVTASSGSGATLNPTLTNSGTSAATVNYTVTVTGGSCTNTFTVPVTVNALPSVTTSTTAVDCRGARTGTATATPSGGEAPYTYLWSGIPQQPTQTATSLAAGIYIVTVTDNNGCQNTATATVTQPATGVDVTISSSGAILCNGGSTTLTASATGGTPGYNYVWNTAAVTAGITATAGSYAVTATDANGCPDVAYTTLTQPTPVTCPFSVQAASCGQSNGSATVTPAGGTPGYTYVWSNGQTTATANGLASGTYTVTVKDSNNCNCVSSATVGSQSGPALISSGPNVSEGSSGGTSPYAYNTHVIQVCQGTLPYNFTWDNSGYVRYDITYSGNCATITIIYADNAAWNVTVSDSNGCTSAELQITNNNGNGTADQILDIINYSVTAQTTSTMGGVDITVAGGGAGCAPYTYLWSNGATTQDISGVPSGWYSVTVSCANGSQHTEGWYWVPKQRRGRSKGEDVVGLSSLVAMPNPFADETTIAFSLPAEGMANVSVYGTDGRRVAELFNDNVIADAGYSVSFNGTNLPAGMYFVKLTTETGEAETIKLTLTK